MKKKKANNVPLPQLVYFRLNPKAPGRPDKILRSIKLLLCELCQTTNLATVKTKQGYLILPFMTGRLAQNARTTLQASNLVDRASIQGYKIATFHLIFPEYDRNVKTTFTRSRQHMKGASDDEIN